MNAFERAAEREAERLWPDTGQRSRDRNNKRHRSGFVRGAVWASKQHPTGHNQEPIPLRDESDAAR